MDPELFLWGILPEDRWIKFQDELSETPPKEAPVCRELPQLEEESTQEETVIAMALEDHIEIGDPLIEGDILTEVGDPLTDDTLVDDPLMVEDLLEEDILMEMGDPLEEEDTLVEDPQMEMEDLLMDKDPLDLLVDKDHLALKDHLDQ